MSEFRRRLMMATAMTLPTGYIKFEDKEVERICIEKWSTDKIGLTYEDAEKVTSIDGISWKGITTFNELKYFKNVKEIGYRTFLTNKTLRSIDLSNITTLGQFSFAQCYLLENVGDTSNIVSFQGSGAFQECDKLNDYKFNANISYFPGTTFSQAPLSNIKEITLNITSLTTAFDFSLKMCDKCYLPKLETFNTRLAWQGCGIKTLILSDNVKHLGNYFMETAGRLETVVLPTIVPPKRTESIFRFTPLKSVYVPDESVEAYKTTPEWQSFADKIKPLSTYVEH